MLPSVLGTVRKMLCNQVHVLVDPLTETQNNFIV